VPPLTLLFRALGLLALAGWSLGTLIGFSLLKGNLERFVVSNFVGSQGRTFLLLAMFAGAAVVAAGAGGYLLAARRRARRAGRAAAGDREALERLYQVGKRISPLCLAGFLPFLFQWRAWQGRELTFLIMVAMLSLAAWTSAKAALSSPPLLRGPRGEAWRRRLSTVSGPLGEVLAGRRWRQLPLAIVVAAGAGYAALFSYFTLTFHRNLRTAAYDLGLEDNLVWNVLHGIGFFRSTPFSGPTGSHFGNHATFFSYVIAPFYALAQGAGTLLFIQSFLIGAAAVPFFLYARRHVGPWAACLISLCYLLYPPVHGANLYEFHYIPLGAFFLWTTLYLLESRRDRAAAVFVILALSVREDIGGAGVAVLGAYLLMLGERPRAGLILAVAGALHFCLLKLVFMPRVAGFESFYIFYKDLLPAGQETFIGVMKTVFGNPFYTLNTLLERDKLFFLLQFFVPLAFIPLRRPIVLLLVVPGFFFTLLSTGYAPLIQTSFQYTFLWTVFLFIGLVDALSRTRPDLLSDAQRALRNRAALFALVCAMIPASYQLGAIFQRHTVKGGFAPYNFETTPHDLADRAAFARIARLIPPRASVSASDNLVPQISNRPVAYTLRFSIFDAEYVLFFSDPLRIDGSERAKVTEALMAGSFGVVDVQPPFALARRGHPTAMNDRVLRPWGAGMPVAPPPPARMPPPAPVPSTPPPPPGSR
jgi:uncharacterized membrane protein